MLLFFGCLDYFIKNYDFKDPRWIDERQGALNAALCSYNAGRGRVEKAIAKGKDPNLVTTGNDYAIAVMAYAKYYSHLKSSNAYNEKNIDNGLENSKLVFVYSKSKDNV